MTAARLAFAVDYSQTALAWPCTPGQHFLLMCCLITKGTHNRGQGCVCTFVGFSFLRSPSMALFLLLNMIIWQGNRKPEQQIYRWICKVGLQQIKVSAEVWYIPFGLSGHAEALLGSNYIAGGDTSKQFHLIKTPVSADTPLLIKTNLMIFTCAGENLKYRLLRCWGCISQEN